MVGAGGLLALALAAAVGPSLLAWHFQDIDPTSFLAPPTARHPLGTTQAGRDVLALTLHGLGRSLLIGLTAAALQTGLAALVGAGAAFVGGWPARLAVWVTDLFLIIPSFLIVAVVLRGLTPDGGSWFWLAFLLALFGWMLAGRVVRSLTLALKHQEYVVAARYLGLPSWRIVTRHILPNIASLLIVDLTLNVGYAVLAETGLSFLGIGLQPPDVSLGSLIGAGGNLAVAYPWVFLPPSGALVLVMLCVNVIGEGLRDALDPGSLAGGRA